MGDTSSCSLAVYGRTILLQLDNIWETRLHILLAFGQHMGETSSCYWVEYGDTSCRLTVYGKTFSLQSGNTWVNLLPAVGQCMGDTCSWAVCGRHFLLLMNRIWKTHFFMKSASMWDTLPLVDGQNRETNSFCSWAVYRRHFFMQLASIRRHFLLLASIWENLLLAVGQYIGEPSSCSWPVYGRHFLLLASIWETLLALVSLWETFPLAVGENMGEPSSCCWLVYREPSSCSWVVYGQPSSCSWAIDGRIFLQLVGQSMGDTCNWAVCGRHVILLMDRIWETHFVMKLASIWKTLLAVCQYMGDTSSCS